MNRVSTIAILVALVISPWLIVAGTWASHYAPNRHDRLNYEYLGQCIAGGHVYYRDCWNNKPPLLPWINAGVLALTDDSTVAITVACGLAAGLFAACVIAGVWCWLGRNVAAVMAVLAAGAISLRFYDGCTNGPDAWAAAFEAVGALGWVMAWRARRWRGFAWGLLGGVGFAAAIATKQFAVVGPVALLISMVIVIVRNRTVWTTIRPGALGGVLGLAGGLGLVGAVLVYQGTLGDAFFASVTFSAKYARGGSVWWGAVQPMDTLARQLEPIALLFWLAALGGAATLARRRDQHPPDAQDARCLPGAIVLGLAIWLVLAVYAAMLGPQPVTRYWQGCFVPLLWLGAQAWPFIGSGLRRGHCSTRVVVVFGVVTAVYLLGRSPVHHQQRDVWATLHLAQQDEQRTRLMAIAGEIQARTTPDDTIYVWGYDSGIYRFSRRFSACRFSGLDKVEHFGQAVQFVVDEIVEALASRRPTLILVPTGSMATIEAGQQYGADVSAFGAMIRDQYTPACRVDRYIIFSRTDAPASLNRPLSAEPPSG